MFVVARRAATFIAIVVGTLIACPTGYGQKPELGLGDWGDKGSLSKSEFENLIKPDVAELISRLEKRLKQLDPNSKWQAGSPEDKDFRKTFHVPAGEHGYTRDFRDTFNVPSGRAGNDAARAGLVKVRNQLEQIKEVAVKIQKDPAKVIKPGYGFMDPRGEYVMGYVFRAHDPDHLYISPEYFTFGHTKEQRAAILAHEIDHLLGIKDPRHGRRGPEKHPEQVVPPESFTAPYFLQAFLLGDPKQEQLFGDKPVGYKGVIMAPFDHPFYDDVHYPVDFSKSASVDVV
jgi:hypothetical protein